MDDLSLWIYIAMFGVAFVAGFVDAIAGGGGLITIPMLMAVVWMLCYKSLREYSAAIQNM